jgi:2-polyprenyl-3-methyl-5-hydroxy-6-metoxy-1,4-benzoquinol methylase
MIGSCPMSTDTVPTELAGESDYREPDLTGQPCVACGSPMRARIMRWSAQCSACGTWRSSLQPAIDSAELHEPIDRSGRIAGFKALRDANNESILDEIAGLVPLKDKRLLDVGSAHGWFVGAASRRGLQAKGIEPEAEMVDHARAQGLNIRPGYFPSALVDNEQVDIISFNDVLEHIPDVNEALDACARALPAGGVLSVNIPSAGGLAYRIASVLALVGFRGPYRRLWQHGLPSPHIHYFTPEALQRLIQRHGFTVVRQRPLSSIRRDGLWARLHTVSRPTASSVIVFLALWIAAPLFEQPRHADVILLLATREDTN